MARILVVEDDQSTREMIFKLLQYEGHEVICAGNGWEALICVENAPPQLIILDMMMPLVTGEKVLRQMRGDARLKTTPVIVSTANRTTQSLGEVTVDEKTFFVNKASGIENMRRGIARALGQEPG